MVWRLVRRPSFLYGLLALCLLWFVLRQVSLAELVALWGRLRWYQLVLLILLNLLVLLTMVQRWSLLLRAEGYRLPFLSLFGYRLTAFGVTYFTPGPQFGGEPLQVYLVQRRHQVPLQSAVAAVTLDKVLEMIVNFGFLVGGALLLLRQEGTAATMGSEALVIAVALLSLPLGLLIAYLRGQHPLGSMFERLQNRLQSTRLRGALPALATLAAGERQVVLLCRNSAATILLAFVVTLVGLALMIIEFAYAAHILGATLLPTEVIGVLLAARLAYLLPMPAGLGTFETSLVLAFQFFHYDATVALALGMLIRTRDTLLGLLGLWWGGMGFLPWSTLRPRWHGTGQQAGEHLLSDSKSSIL